MRTVAIALGVVFTSLSALAEPQEGEATVVVDHVPQVKQEPFQADVIREEAPSRRGSRIYVEADGKTYRSTRAGEYCVYKQERDQIHCYDHEPRDTVYVEESRTYRSTRPGRHYREGIDPIATGLGVGLAIGIPLLVHHNYDRRYGSHHRYSRHHHNSRYNRHGYRNYNYGYTDGYRHGYNKRYGHHRGYGKGYYRGYKDGYRQNRGKSYFKYGKYRY